MSGDDMSDEEYLDPQYIENQPFWNYRNDGGVGEEIHDRVDLIENVLKALLRKVAPPEEDMAPYEEIRENIQRRASRASSKRIAERALRIARPAGNADPTESTRPYDFTKDDLEFVIAILDQCALGNPVVIGPKARNQAADIHGDLCNFREHWNS